MKNYRLFCLLLAILPILAAAQSTEATVMTTKKLKVVFQLMSSDSLDQKSLIKQLDNFLAAAPNSTIEVVCHSNGIALLQTALTKYGPKIRELKGRGVDFVACENTMRDKKIKPEELVPECRTVPAGVVEVALKEDKGWNYIKAGL